MIIDKTIGQKLLRLQKKSLFILRKDKQPNTFIVVLYYIWGLSLIIFSNLDISVAYKTTKTLQRLLRNPELTLSIDWVFTKQNLITGI